MKPPLRAAIEAVNAGAGTSTIQFTVNGTVTLTNDLPAITKGVTIDATTAPTHVSGGPPVVEINCNGHEGLRFGTGSDASQLLGLAVCNACGHGVMLDGGSTILAGNYVELNLAGAAAGNAADGVHVSSTSSRNLIGSNPTAASGVISNVISGNGGNGIGFEGAVSNTRVNNYIGTDPTGSFAIPNAGNGIRLTAGSAGNELGGTAFTDTSTGVENDPTGNKGSTAPTFVVPPLGNLVSGNDLNGILIDADSRNNILNGNFVGTTASGSAPLGNTLDGVAIQNADNNSLLGCTFVQPPFTYYNVLSGNGGNGITLQDGTRCTTILNNLIGLTKAGNRLPNAGVPIATGASTNNVIRANQTFP